MMSLISMFYRVNKNKRNKTSFGVEMQFLTSKTYPITETSYICIINKWNRQSFYLFPSGITKLR